MIFQATQLTNGKWAVADKHGYPVRVHNGYAEFADAKQANWAAELANIGCYTGEDNLKSKFRELLGIFDDEAK